MADEELGELEAPEVPASEEEGSKPETEAPAELSTDTEGNEAEVEVEGESGDQDVEETVLEDGGGELDLIDWETGGKTYKVPADLKPHLMMNADYTRKTQEVSEQRAALEERQQSFDQQVESQQALLADYAQVKAIEQQIAQYNEVDWVKLDEEDPMTANQHRWNLQQLKDARSTQIETIRTKEQERSRTAQRETVKRTEEYQNALAREIKGWGPELNLALSQYGRAAGYSDQELSSVRDVRQVKTLMKAHLWDQHLQRQKAAAKPKPKPDVKPLAKPAKGKAPARTGLSDDMDIKDWAAMRNKQVAAKRGY